MHLATRMRLIRGEVKRSAQTGVDMFWATQPNTPDSHVANHLAALMVGTPGVTDAILKFNFEGETGSFDVQAKVTYDSDDLRQRRSEHESFQLSPPALIGGIGGPTDA